MGMANILKEPEGSAVTVVEMAQYMAYKHQNECPDDVLFITYRDENNVKKVQSIRKPPMEFYFTKPEYRGQWKTPREYIELEKVYPVKVEAKRVVSTIYKELQNEHDEVSEHLKRVYQTAVQTQNWSARKEVFKWPNVFFADVGVEDYYRIMVGYHYDTINKDHTATKGYLDIESDIVGLTTSQTNNNEDKTNAVTIILNRDSVNNVDRVQSYTFLLRNHGRYPQQAFFEDHIDKFIGQCHAEFDEVKVTKKGKSKIIKTDIDFHIVMFDKESELLSAVFGIINRHRPDILGIWNIAYDMPKMQARMYANGMNPIDIMSDPAFPKACRFVDLNIDSRPGIDIADRKTYVKMTSTTKYIDQMQTYANLRKGLKAYGSNALDNIAEIELGIHKRKFKKGVDVTNACVADYWNFVLYNINDVFLQYLIDLMTNDMYALIVDSNQSNCAIENLTKQTRYNKQIYYTNYLRRGYVPGSNINNDYIGNRTDENADIIREMREASLRRAALDRMIAAGEIDPEDDIDMSDIDIGDLDEGFLSASQIADKVVDVYSDSIDRNLKLMGAIVGHPNLNSRNGMELVEGVPSMHVYDYVIDMDYTAEYPNAKDTRSISRSTQYGRLIIPKKISDRQNTYDVENYIPGSEFVSDYISADYVSLGNVWFGLPSTDEMEDLIKERMAKKHG